MLLDNVTQSVNCQTAMSSDRRSNDVVLTILSSQEVAKKRSRRTVKHQRAVVGASLEVIKERRNVRPEVRKSAREEAVKDAKQKKAEAEAKKKAEKAKAGATGAKRTPVQSKQGAKGPQQKVKATTR